MSDFSSKDIVLLEESVRKTLKDGCKECNFRHVIFTTNVSQEPNGTKVFFLEVECPKCNVKYTDIMAMRDTND
jgi:ribosomal protein S27E